ncbi:MAG: SWIM zinc finger domain-containing protein [Deltaproteobacteria bacterium]|nr:SWIM zinc finger domain-containing protein [Deltaproteobacteria bacterium]
MTKKNQTDNFLKLSWDNLNEWAGSSVVTRGEKYHKQGRVSGLAKSGDNSIVAWVKGGERYATKVKMNRGGLPESICTCPYTYECKHGVATVLAYLEHLKKNIPVPKAEKRDERLMLVDDKFNTDETEDDDISTSGKSDNIELFLKDQSKDGLISLVNDLRIKYPEVDRYLRDRRSFNSGKMDSRIKHIQKQIEEATKEPGWQNHWDGQGFTPDFSEIRDNMTTLLDEGHADDVLSLGRKLMAAGTELVETSDDEGETAFEIERCMSVVIRALKESSLDPVEKLKFAVESLIEDEYSIFKLFAEYIDSGHHVDVWNEVADIMLARLENLPVNSTEPGLSRYKRDQISNWAITALDKSGRDKEIIPLCEKEAPITDSYSRLVKRLIEKRLYDDAEKWIREGNNSTGNSMPGIASALRGQLLDIRVKQKNHQAVAVLKVYEYVYYPSIKAYQECKLASEKSKDWEKVRTCIHKYLENGKLPWKQREWPLPQPDIDFTEPRFGRDYPMAQELISIAILEKNPEKVLFWYDKCSDRRFGFGGNYDEVADAIKTYAPERAFDIWKTRAERLIDLTKPKAYEEAVVFLKKAKKLMSEINKLDKWNVYINSLRKTHAAKRRLMEILDRMDRKPIVNE